MEAGAVSSSLNLQAVRMIVILLGEHSVRVIDRIRAGFCCMKLSNTCVNATPA
jgi:hypothetical protein